MSKIDDLIKYYNGISDPDPEWSGPATADYNTLKEEIESDLDRLEKLEKFIGIIKSGKECQIDWINSKKWNSKEVYDEFCNYENYLVRIKLLEYKVKDKYILTEEEFEFLKEVLEKEIK